MKKFIATIMACSLLLSYGCTPKEVHVAKRISKSTVLVHIIMHNKVKHGGALCAGVIVSPHEILLANHCVNPSSDVTIDKIWVRDFNGYAQEATIKIKDPADDLALLKIKHAEKPAKIAYSQPPVGSTVWVAGMPLGITWAVTKGIVSRTDAHVFGFVGSFFITDAVVLPGNSGGGVWSENGELIGIVSMSTSMMGGFGASGLGIIVDTGTIRDFLYY